MIDSLITAVLVATLLFTIADDWRNYTIRNEAILILLGLFVVNVLVHGSYAQLVWHVALALTMFALLLVIYGRGWLGGGDVKLLALAFLWIPTARLSIFALLMSALVIAYYVAAKFKLAPSRGQSKIFIPFAPCISGAWLLTLLMTIPQ